MSLKPVIRCPFRSLVARLTFTYSLLFSVVCCAGVILMYWLTVAHLGFERNRELIAEKEELVYFIENESIETIQHAFEREAADEGSNNSFFRLVSQSGELLASAGMSTWATEELTASRLAEPANKTGQPRTISLRDSDREICFLSAEVAPGRFLQIGMATDIDEPFLSAFRYTATVTVGLLLLLGPFIGWRVARRALVGVEEVTRAANRIIDGHLDERVQVAGRGEEIDRLCKTFNRMTERLQKLITEMCQVNDNIAHDLRSPITRIRALAETAVTGEANLAEFRERCGRTIEECDRLLGMINTMLDISEAEAGLDDCKRERIDLNEVSCQAVELFQPLAEGRGIALRTRLQPAGIIRGDLRRIQRTIANLIDNAIKYAGSGGQVTLSTETANGCVRLSVQDTGAGMSEEEKSKIFGRFYRGDRSRSQPGNGLGLSFAAAVVRAHNGHIHVDSEPGKGTTFTIVLPIADPDEPSETKTLTLSSP